MRTPRSFPRNGAEPHFHRGVLLPTMKEEIMAYTDPNTGITRDKYGNEVRDASGTGRPSTNYVPWIIGLAFAAVVAVFAFNGSNMSNNSTADRSVPETSTTQPATPKVTTNTPAP